MIFKKFFGLAVFFILLAPSVSYGYIFPVLRYTNLLLTPSSNPDFVGKYLAFEIFKLSLTKNNISFTFADYALTSDSVSYPTINGLTLGFGYSGQHSTYIDTCWVVLWPRTSLDSSGVCDCDYSVFCTFYNYNNGGDDFYVYFDSGVVTVTNYLGDGYSTPWENKNVVLNTSLTCSMPFDYSASSLVNYFVRPTRILNLTQTGTQTSVTSFRFGSIAELFSYQFRYSFLQACGSPSDVSFDVRYFDLRTKQNISQSMLPWQLQIYNPSFDTSVHTKPTEQFSADTDGGTERDVSEYYTGHNYLNVPEDDWGQPADIGGGSSGTGGEITGFSQGAQSQMTYSGENALENYFGDPTDTDLDVVSLPTSDDEFDERDDIDLESTWLTQTQGALTTPQTETSALLPDGVNKFQQIVNALKNPDNRSMPVITLPFRFDLTAFHNGRVFDTVNKPTIDFSFLLQSPYNTYYVGLRSLVVLFMSVCVVIYILKDTMFMGNRVTE